MVCKYTVDALIIRIGFDRAWGPLDYLTSPVLSTLGDPTAATWDTNLVRLGLMAWALPFLWIGVGMTMRRLQDAGRSAWLGLLFLLPGINYIVMLLLCFLPSREGATREIVSRAAPLDRRFSDALLGAAAGLGITALLTGLGIHVLGEYGAFLFLGCPFVLGAVSTLVHERRGPKRINDTLLVVILAVLLACGSLLMFAVEGLICILMASPLIMGGAIIGALVARSLLALERPRPGNALPALLLLPLIAWFEAKIAEPVAFEIASAIEIDAPPEVVWEHVIAFSELPPPNWFLFEAGIAYPVRARIEGEGVGAVRHCEFSTGAFVEPITAWEAPRRLAFDVIEQPAPMEEWSPYRSIHPPHLDGYLRSRRGEFRLIPLPGGRTRLEGSTWYELDLLPAAYWRIYTDAFIRRIHGRVLEHVARLAEAERGQD